MKMKRLLLPALALLSLTSSLRAEDGKVTVSGINISYPTTWKFAEPTNNMRAGSLMIPVEGVDKPLEAVIFYFGAGQGGDAQANISRWLGQFESKPESKTEEIVVGGKTVTLVTATGTYMDGPMFAAKTPKADYTLLGAIIPGNDAPVFIKLAGPKAAIATLTEEFKKVITSPFAAK